jgi:putative ABC transport system substrate-binding protein
LAADLVGRRVDILAAIGPPCARAAKNATSTIPIVFTVGTDPIADGLIDNLARPGGNLTGVSILAVDLTLKRFEVLSELVPQARVIALLVNPNNANPWIGDVWEAARVRGIQLEIIKASTESEIDAAFAVLVQQHSEALLIGDDVFFTSRHEQLVTLASRYSVPVIERWREFAISGGLVSYGTSLADASRLAGAYTARVLKGEKPGDLPVQQSTKIELVINLKTANALGIDVPPTLLARVDEVIE